MVRIRSNNTKDVRKSLQIFADKVDFYRNPCRATIAGGVNVSRGVDDAMFFIRESSFVNHLRRDFGRVPRLATITCEKDLSPSPSGVTKLFIRKSDRQK